MKCEMPSKHPKRAIVLDNMGQLRPRESLVGSHGR
jgi:hypothetical protein